MSTFRRRAFVFVSSHTSPELGPVERGFVAVMAELVALGASVHYIAPHGSPALESARAVGATVAPFRLNRTNVVRSVSRLRKYLRRVGPVVAHTTGHEATVVVRFASRPLGLSVVETVLADEWPPRGRNRAASRARRSIDRRTNQHSDFALTDTEDLRRAMIAAGYDGSRVKAEPLVTRAFDRDAQGDGPDPVARLVREHLAIYERLVARWEGPPRAKNPKRGMTLRRVRRDARKAVKKDGR